MAAFSEITDVVGSYWMRKSEGIPKVNENKVFKKKSE
jgi:hypothetical protein